MQRFVLRAVWSLSSRGFASHTKPHVHMPETAMLSNNGTHRFERKGWEYSTYMGILGGPLLLILGLSNAPETDSEVFAREEVLAKRSGQEIPMRRPSVPASKLYSFKPSEIGEPPVLEED